MLSHWLELAIFRNIERVRMEGAPQLMRPVHPFPDGAEEWQLYGCSNRAAVTTFYGPKAHHRSEHESAKCSWGDGRRMMRIVK